MDDLSEQLQDFEELHKFGVEFLTRLEDAVKFAEKERDDAYDKLKEANSTNKKLSEALFKCQGELETITSERDRLLQSYNSLQKDMEVTSNERKIYKEKFERVAGERDALKNKLIDLKKILER